MHYNDFNMPNLNSFQPATLPVAIDKTIIAIISAFPQFYLSGDGKGVSRKLEKHYKKLANATDKIMDFYPTIPPESHYYGIVNRIVTRFCDEVLNAGKPKHPLTLINAYAMLIDGRAEMIVFADAINLEPLRVQCFWDIRNCLAELADYFSEIKEDYPGRIWAGELIATRFHKIVAEEIDR